MLSSASHTKLPLVSETQYLQYEYTSELVLANDECFKVFCDFCVKTHNEENIKFTKQVQEMKKQYTKDTDMQEQATKLFKEFVKAGSKLEINVPNDVRDKCWGKIQSQEYATAFDDCYVAVTMHLSHLFNLFKSSDMFANMLKHKTKSFLATIGTEKAQVVHTKMTVADMDRAHFTHEDFTMMHEMVKDYAFWKTVYADNKSALLYSSRVFQTDEALAKYGFLSPFKTNFTFQCECTLQQLMQVVASADFLKHFYPFATLETVQLVQDQYPCVLVRGTLRLGKIMSIRHVCELWTIQHHVKLNRFCIVRKCCEPPALVPFPKDAVVQRNVVVATFHQIMNNMFLVDHVAVCNLGGNFAFAPSSQDTAMKMMKLLRGATTKAFKKVILSHVQQMKESKWEPKDDLGLLKVVQTL